MNSIKKSLFIITATSLLLVLPGCIYYQKNNATTVIAPGVAVTQPAKPIVTVWIHGTKLTPESFMYKFFYRKMGLHPCLSYDECFHMRTIANTLNNDPVEFPLEHFYIFGWSGKLNFQERKKCSHDLFNELLALQKKYQETYNMQPYFRLITHSHGGNVALNLALHNTQEQYLNIDELILLACPVQTKTMHLIKDPCFKQIYSFYSESDLIQIIDPQGLYKNKEPNTSLFSKRVFEPQQNLIQIKACSSKRGLMHIEFIYLKFLKHFPQIMKWIKLHTCSDNTLKLQLVKKHESSPRKAVPHFIINYEPAA